ncbi:hypothetical protein RZN32_25065, partial [Klebsiella pneumoniae]|nr:hypothetical protein [Klebsiella pneumoniae]
ATTKMLSNAPRVCHDHSAEVSLDGDPVDVLVPTPYPLQPALSKQMAESGVTLHAAPSALPQLQNGPAKVEPVKAEQYDDEYLSLDLNVKVVADMDEAIAHIREHGTQHSDAILTRTLRNANRFINEVDSSAVYVNASTRFTDGGQFGLGAEVAVSTQKLHARGPMGLEALTTYKWIGFGDDTIRA